MGIRHKLLLCLFAVLLPLAGVGMLATHLVDLQTAERTTAALANTHRLEAARIEQILGGYATDARSLASGSHVRDFVAKVDAVHHADGEIPIEETLIGGQDEFAIVDTTADWPLQQLALALQRKAGIIGSSIVELRLVDQAGHTLGETLGFSWTPTDPSLIARAMHTVKTEFGDAFINIDNRERLGMVSPILSNGGEVVGAIVLESRLGPIINLVSKHEAIGTSIEAHIAQATPNGDAQFITPLRFDRTAAFNKVVPAKLGLPVNKALESPQSQIIKALDYRGVESFLAVQTIAGTGWGLIVKVDTQETFAPVARLRSLLLWATGASIGFVALIYLFFLVPVVQRLKSAASAAGQILDGDLSARLLDEKNDEITDLATSINCLARDLEKDQKMRSEVEARLRYQALHDELTGLMNRKHVNTVIELLTEDTNNEHSVMFLDLNGFKDVNDLYGHAAGDEVLIKVANRLSTLVPQGATLARWGGDEFVIILPTTTEIEATHFAVTLHNAFDDPVCSSKSTHNISCSIGLATSSPHKSLEQALLEADALMYEQKKQQDIFRSKGGVTTRGVERALSENRMEIWFQPMVRMERPGNYTLIGADTHMRMRNSLGGYVLPQDFMHELKDTSVLRELDNRTLNLALDTLHRWNQTGIVDNSFLLSIRLSEQMLNDAVFPNLLHSQLRKLKLLPSQIQLELPDEPTRLSEAALSELRNSGIRLALNGVDTEPNLLRLVPATRPTTAIIGKPCPEDKLVMPHLLDICQELQVDIMASHVDTREQLEQLHAMGVTQFQGNLFERPVRAIDFVSRWGQTRLTGLGKITTSHVTGMRLAG